MVTTFTYKPSLVRIDARNFELSWQTHPQTHTVTRRQDRLQYIALQLASVQYNEAVQSSAVQDILVYAALQ